MTLFTKWCPNEKFNHNGHSKSVVSKFANRKIKKRYYCAVCNTWFTAKQLKKVN